MPLRLELEAVPETLQDQELAAEQRYWEGIELLVQEQGAGGVYLLGFVAEIHLKLAYFRFVGRRPADPVDGCLQHARRQGRQLIPVVRDESYHSIRFWWRLLDAERSHQARLWNDDFRREVEWRSERLYNDWWIEMRYRQTWPVQADQDNVLDHVSWIRAHRIELGT